MKINKLKAFLDQYRLALGFLIGLALIFINMVRIYVNIPYNSDDVSQQVLLKQWQEYGFDKTWFPTDTFILKFPIHFIIQSLGLNPRHEAFVAMTFMNVSAYILIFFVFRYFARIIFNIKNDLLWLIPLLFVYSINSTTFSYSIKNINLRIIETGIMFAILALIARWLRRERATLKKRNSHTIFFAIIGIGIFFFNDPAFVVFLGLPLILMIALLASRGETYKIQAVKLSFLLIGSLISYKIIEKISISIGVMPYDTYAHFVEYDRLWSSISIGFHGLLNIFGADFFGKLSTSFSSLRALLTASVLFAGIFGTYYFLKTRNIRQKNPWLVVVMAQPPLLFLSYVISENSTDLYTARYLYLIPFYFVLIIAALLTKSSKSVQFFGLCLIGFLVILNAASSVSSIYSQPQASTVKRNQNQQVIVNTLEREGLTKGYAGFWSANINNYLSNGRLAITPVSCPEPKMRVFYWLYTDSLKKIKTDKTFMLVSRGEEAAPGDYGPAVWKGYECDNLKLERELGKPQKVLQPTTGTSIYIYDYDISTRFINRTNERTP